MTRQFILKLSRSSSKVVKLHSHGRKSWSDWCKLAQALPS